jgi:hypothetical protein
MLTLANPTDEEIAKAKVMSQTAQPAAAVVRRATCHCPAHTLGKTSATASEATPTARNR